MSCVCLGEREEHEVVRPTVLSLFSGIGGFDKGLEMAGFRVIGQCDNDPFANKVLAKHWPGVPRYGDVSTALVAHADADGCCLECGQRLVNFGTLVHEPVTIGAEQDAVIQRKEPALALGNDVVSIAGSLGPSAAHTTIAIEPNEGLVPSAFVGVSRPFSDEVGAPLVPGNVPVLSVVLEMVPTDESMGPSPLINGPQFSTASAGAIGDNHQSHCTKLHWAELIVGGFPCQDLSVAGLRRGLQASRSGLFFQFMRIVRDMREASSGRFPVAVVAENVPGLFSSASGRDFGVVLNALAECGTVDIAWRTIDSQHWVPQRRRRVFIVAVFPSEAFGRAPSGCAAEILSLCEGGDWHPQTGRETGEDVAGTVAGGAYGAGRRPDNLSDNLVANPLPGHHPRQDLDNDTYVQDLAPSLRARGSQNGSPERDDIALIAHTLSADGVDASEDGTGRGTPLVAIQERAVSENLDNGPGGKGWREDGLAYTLEARNTVQAVAGTLTSGGEGRRGHRGDDGTDTHVIGGSTVRRLTPIECERLQAFPDMWTCICDQQPCRCPDGPRYKALGNAVTTSVIEYLGCRIKVVLDERTRTDVV